MARIKGELKHGLKLGKEVYKTFELSDHLTAGQIIEAKEQAEKVVPFNDGQRLVPAVVESPARLGGLLLCQQIVAVGVITGPLDYDLFSALHQDDLEILNAYADLAAGAIDGKALSRRLTDLGHTAKELTDRGRGVDSGSEPDDDGSQAAEKRRDAD